MRSTEDLVIAAVLPRARMGTGGVYSEMDFVLSQQIDDTYFTGLHQLLFQASVAANVLNQELDDEILEALLIERKAEPSDILRCHILSKELAGLSVTREKLRVVLPPYRDRIHSERLGVSLEEAAAVLTDGLTVDGERLTGYKAARSLLVSRFADLERREIGTLPQEEIHESAQGLIKEYENAKLGGSPGVMTGFREMDRLTNGQQIGELFIVCGYTSEGKSQFLLNAAWDASVMQGKSVAFVSLEMKLAQVKRRIISRHSNHAQFGIPGGLEYNKIKRGALDIYEEKLFKATVDDFETNKAYGGLHVIQMSKQDTIKNLTEKLMYLRSRTLVDLVVLDYASLMASARRRSERREEITDVIEDLKALCLQFNQGEGTRVLTANQISRNAKIEADKLGWYGMAFASDTSAIEKNADLLAWILRTDLMKANREVAMGIAKYRDGDVGEKFRLVEHFESSLMCDLSLAA